jgi:hypothetical protein
VQRAHDPRFVALVRGLIGGEVLEEREVAGEAPEPLGGLVDRAFGQLEAACARCTPSTASRARSSRGGPTTRRS